MRRINTRLITYTAFVVSALTIVVNIVLAIIYSEMPVMVILAWFNSLIWIGVSVFLSVIIDKERKHTKEILEIFTKLEDDKNEKI